MLIRVDAEKVWRVSEILGRDDPSGFFSVRGYISDTEIFICSTPAINPALISECVFPDIILATCDIFYQISVEISVTSNLGFHPVFVIPSLYMVKDKH